MKTICKTRTLDIDISREDTSLENTKFVVRQLDRDEPLVALTSLKYLWRKYFRQTCVFCVMSWY